MRLIGLIAFTLLATAATGQALDPPAVTCVEVMPDGSALVSWELPDDPGGEFTGYEIHQSTDYFLSVDNVVATEFTYATTNYLDASVDVNAVAGSSWYVVTLSNDGTPQASVPSDTLNAIHLDVVVQDLGGTALLQWNTVRPQFESVAGSYEIWMEYPAGTWQVVQTIPHNTQAFTQIYSHEVEGCEIDPDPDGDPLTDDAVVIDIPLNFQIRYQTAAGCNYVSNIEGNLFKDQTPPAIPEVDVASVDITTNEPTVSWLPSFGNDVTGYIIYQCINSLPVPIDTVYGATTTSYVHAGENAQINLPPNRYTVAAFDGCLFTNVSPTEDFCHQPPHLLDPQWIACTTDVDLLWTPYEGRDVQAYEIYMSENAGPFTILAAVPGNELTFTHENVIEGATYEYYIVATFLETYAVSYSNTRTQTIQSDVAPAFTYLASVSVEDEGEVGIRVLTEEVPLDHLYLLERREAGDINFSDVDNTLSANSQFVDFTDEGLNTNELQYEYRVTVLNDCGDTIRVTNIGRTILLSGLANSERLANTVAWQDYTNWDGLTDQFTVYRSTSPGDLGIPVGTQDPSFTVFEDNVQDELLTPGLFCYTIQAQENVNAFGLSEVSKSNQLCLQMEPKIWIPNAFVVYGVNNTFKPVIGYADFQTYRMRIYSRWGDTLFETADIKEGWDGQWKDGLVPEGAYVYFIEVRDGRGQLHERTGTVYMLVNGVE